MSEWRKFLFQVRWSHRTGLNQRSFSVLNVKLQTCFFVYLFTSYFKSITFRIISFVPIYKLCNRTTRLNIQRQFTVYSERCEFVDNSCLSGFVTVFRFTIKYRSFGSYGKMRCKCLRFNIWLVILTCVTRNQSIGRFILMIAELNA